MRFLFFQYGNHPLSSLNGIEKGKNFHLNFEGPEILQMIEGLGIGQPLNSSKNWNLFLVILGHIERHEKMYGFQDKLVGLQNRGKVFQILFRLQWFRRLIGLMRAGKQSHQFLIQALRLIRLIRILVWQILSLPKSLEIERPIDKRFLTGMIDLLGTLFEVSFPNQLPYWIQQLWFLTEKNQSLKKNQFLSNQFLFERRNQNVRDQIESQTRLLPDILSARHQSLPYFSPCWGLLFQTGNSRYFQTGNSRYFLTENQRILAELAQIQFLISWYQWHTLFSTWPLYCWIDLSSSPLRIRQLSQN